MSREKPQPKKIGMIGSNDVVQYGDAPCLVVGKTWLSAGKVKAVLANLEACKQFLLTYDKPEAPKAAPAPVATAETKEQLLAKMQALQAQVAALSAQSNGHYNRLDPVKG